MSTVFPLDIIECSHSYLLVSNIYPCFGLALQPGEEGTGKSARGCCHRLKALPGQGLTLTFVCLLSFGGGSPGGEDYRRCSSWKTVGSALSTPVAFSEGTLV